jgi:translation elongation factor EF-Tu-like GTPase
LVVSAADGPMPQTREHVELSKILATQQNEQAARESAERLQNLEIANERDLFNAEASLRVNTGEGI